MIVSVLFELMVLLSLELELFVFVELFVLIELATSVEGLPTLYEYVMLGCVSAAEPFDGLCASWTEDSDMLNGLDSKARSIDVLASEGIDGRPAPDDGVHADSGVSKGN